MPITLKGQVKTKELLYIKINHVHSSASITVTQRASYKIFFDQVF